MLTLTCSSTPAWPMMCATELGATSLTSVGLPSPFIGLLGLDRIAGCESTYTSGLDCLLQDSTTVEISFDHDQKEKSRPARRAAQMDVQGRPLVL
jgi:hypothetical protein